MRGAAGRATRCAGRLRSADDGSILPLVFGFFVVALALVLIVSGVTSLYLERARLYTLADGAALAAADSVQLGEAQAQAQAQGQEQEQEQATGQGMGQSRSDGGPAPSYREALMKSAAFAYLDVATEGRHNPVRLVSAQSDDGRGVTVRLAEDWRPPLVSVFVPRGIRIEVEGDARPVFW